MKRLVIIPFIIAVLGIISPDLTTSAQPIRDPHENPATATGFMDEVALLFHYSLIINLAASRQYQDAQEALKEIREVDIPDELRYIINRYNDLCQQLFIALDNIETALDEASDLIARNQTYKAKESLDIAEVNIQDALLLLEDVVAATDTLSNRLGIIAKPIISQVREAYTRLKESVEQLRQLIDRLYNFRQSLTERYIEIMGLVTTEVSLSIRPESVFVGDDITASGILNGDGKPMLNKNLALILDNELITTATTTINGSYVTSITIPYHYTDNISLIALYEPSGDDAEIYLASQSPPVIIHTMFYPTLLEVSAPQIVHPGLPFTINGQVISNYGNTDRTIKVLLDDAQLTEAIISGQFSLEVTPPVYTPTDNYSLTVAVTPLGRYSGFSETRRINICPLPVYIDIQTPNLILLPKSTQVHGTVYSELGPVSDAVVCLTLKDTSSTVRTSQDGSFTALLEASLDLSFISLPQITIDIEPSVPWATPLTVKRQVFTINPLSTGLILVILMALALFVYRRSQMVYEKKGIPLTEVMELPTVIPSRVPRARLTGIKGKILAAYWGGLEAVEKFCGVYMAPHTTLREFLKMVTTLLPKITSQFTELTTIAENTLYSNSSPHKDTAMTAEQLASTIKEELHHGTS